MAGGKKTFIVGAAVAMERPNVLMNETITITNVNENWNEEKEEEHRKINSKWEIMPMYKIRRVNHI